MPAHRRAPGRRSGVAERDRFIKPLIEQGRRAAAHQASPNPRKKRHEHIDQRGGLSRDRSGRSGRLSRQRSVAEAVVEHWTERVLDGTSTAESSRENKRCLQLRQTPASNAWAVGKTSATAVRRERDRALNGRVCAIARETEPRSSRPCDRGRGGVAHERLGCRLQRRSDGTTDEDDHRRMGRKRS